MAKEPLDRIKVRNKGTVWMLNPGHAVYALNLLTGMAYRVKLYQIINWKFWQRKETEYWFIRKPNHEYLPAMNIYKAGIAFRTLIKQLEKHKRPEVQLVKE